MNLPTPAPVPGSKIRLWVALLVMLVLLLAMGATLMRIQSRPFEPRPVVLPKSAQTPVAQAAPSVTPPAKPAAATPLDTSATAGSANLTIPTIPINQATNMPQALANQAQGATENKVNQAIQITAQPRPVAPRTSEPAVARPPAAGAPASATPATQ
jgi:flagellar basal body-associated protein FliL